MADLLAHPAIQSGALPFTLALCVAALLGFSNSALNHAVGRLAGLAVVVAFVGSSIATFGLPPLVPKASGQKIAAIALFAAITGMLFQGRLRSQLVPGLVVVTISTMWIGWRRIMAAPSLDHLFAVLILCAAGLALMGTERETDDESDRLIPLLVVSLGFSGIALIGASASIAQNAGALAAALGGVLILNWPVRRFTLGPTARLVPLVVLSALGSQIIFFTSAPGWALALLLPAFLAPRWVSTGNRLNRPVLVALFATVPTVAALAATWFAVSSDLSGGY